MWQSFKSFRQHCGTCDSNSPKMLKGAVSSKAPFGRSSYFLKEDPEYERRERIADAELKFSVLSSWSWYRAPFLRIVYGLIVLFNFLIAFRYSIPRILLGSSKRAAKFFSGRYSFKAFLRAHGKESPFLKCFFKRER